MNIKEFFVGKKRLQPFFERLHRISLRGMNYGLGGIISSSGEINLIQLVKQKLEKRKDLVVFDVGANDGQYAEILRREFSPTDLIYCFEPSRHSFQTLQRKFGNSENMVLENYGFGSRKETRKLYFDDEGSGWASVFERDDTGFNNILNKSEDVRITTIDSFCKEKAIPRINFLKIDVEGFEFEILKGATKMLSNIDFIQFEFSFANFNSRTYLYEFFEILKDFEINRVLNDGIHPLRYDPRYEILMTTNYLAINNSFQRTDISST